jgi:hypothetical protein
MCTVLNARISTPRHFSFILRGNTGINSLSSLINPDFMKKMNENLQKLKNDPIFIQMKDK